MESKKMGNQKKLTPEESTQKILNLEASIEAKDKELKLKDEQLEELTKETKNYLDAYQDAKNHISELENNKSAPPAKKNIQHQIGQLESQVKKAQPRRNTENMIKNYKKRIEVLKKSL